MVLHVEIQDRHAFSHSRHLLSEGDTSLNPHLVAEDLSMKIGETSLALFCFSFLC